MATRMTSKGQVTIPKPVRDALGLRAGATVEFMLNGDGHFVLQPGRKPKRALRGRFASVRGVGTLKMTTRRDPRADAGRLRHPPPTCP